MKTVGTYQAKTHFSKLLERVEKGERITITRHGVPIARLVPPERTAALTAEDAVAELRGLRKECTLGGLPLKSAIEEGRRH